MAREERTKLRNTRAGELAQYVAVVVFCIGAVVVAVTIAGLMFGLHSLVDWTPWWKGALTFLGYGFVAFLVMWLALYLIGGDSGHESQVRSFDPPPAGRFLGKVFVGLYYLFLWSIGVLLVYSGLNLIGVSGQPGGFLAIGVMAAVAIVLFIRSRR